MIEHLKVWVPFFGGGIIAAGMSSYTAFNTNRLSDQLSQPEAKIVWPLAEEPTGPCVHVAGYFRNIPADEQLFVVLPTEEENGNKTYNYPVKADRSRAQWSTLKSVLMTTPGAQYSIYLYALRGGQREVFEGHHGLPRGKELDVVSVKRSDATLTQEPCKP
jgi:hypothetical protein